MLQKCMFNFNVSLFVVFLYVSMNNDGMLKTGQIFRPLKCYVYIGKKKCPRFKDENKFLRRCADFGQSF